MSATSRRVRVILGVLACKNLQQGSAQRVCLGAPTMSPSMSLPSRSRAAEEHALLRWVAELYYEQQQGQADIAEVLGASVSKVSRLLAEARRRGIVTIHVEDSRAGESDL